MNLESDQNAALASIRAQVEHMLKNIPENVFGDIYAVLVHSCRLQAIVGHSRVHLGEAFFPFERAHQDFVAILKTANLGDLVEKLHDVLAQQKDPFRPVPSDATRLVTVCQLPELVGKVRFLDERDGEWRPLTGMRGGPSDARGRHGDYVLLSGPYSLTLDAHASVATRPLHELQEMR